MTNIERFQKLQVELVRAGFATGLHAQPKGEEAILTMHVQLQSQTPADMERLEVLTAAHGFSYKVGENSQAAITLAA